MALHYYYKKCDHEGCKATSYMEFKNRRDYLESRRKYDKNGYKCVRHAYPEEVLSTDNTETKITYTVFEKKHGKYWQKDKDKGTEKVNSGFIHGDGYKAYAKDFNTGTKITITTKLEQF